MEPKDLHHKIVNLYKRYFPRLGANYFIPPSVAYLVPVSITEEDLEEGFKRASHWWADLASVGKVEPGEVPQFPAVLTFVIEAARKRRLVNSQPEQLALKERIAEIRSFRDENAIKLKAKPDGTIEEVEK